MSSNTAANMKNILGFKKTMASGLSLNGNFCNNDTQERSKTNQPSWHEVHKEAQNQGQQL